MLLSRRSAILGGGACSLYLGGIGDGVSQTSSFTIIRDAEIETLLYSYARILFPLGGLSTDGLRIFIVRDRSFNAFVDVNKRMFVNTGLFLELDQSTELLAVLAHETSHLALGHPFQTQLEVKDAASRALLSSMIGIVGGLASGEVGLAVGASSLGHTIAQQQFLEQVRVRESQADIMALDMLHRLGLDVSVFKRLFGIMERLGRISVSENNYFRTHPLAEERKLQLDREISKLRSKPYRDGDYYDTDFFSNYEELYQRMRVKVQAYTLPLEESLKRFTLRKDLLDIYGFAITLSRYGRSDEPIRLLKEVSDEWLDYGYVDEILSGLYLRIGEREESLFWMSKAVEKSGESALLCLAYGELLLRGEDEVLAERWFWKALEQEDWLLGAWRGLMNLYSKQGRRGELFLSHAYFAFYQGHAGQAFRLAEDAIPLLEDNPRLLAMANDILIQLSR